MLAHFNGLHWSGCFASANVAAKGSIHVSSNDLDVNWRVNEVGRRVELAARRPYVSVREAAALSVGFVQETRLFEHLLPEFHQVLIMYRLFFVTGLVAIVGIVLLVVVVKTAVVSRRIGSW